MRYASLAIFFINNMLTNWLQKFEVFSIQPNLFPYVRKSSYLCKRILGMKYLKS